MFVKPSKVPQTGLSMVELLVGVTLGLFLVGGAAKLFVDYLGSSRNMLVETRVNQDLRAAADIIARDLRRAGYWGNSLAGVVYPAASNPYRATTPSGPASAAAVTYSFSRDPTENNVRDANENFGFQLNGGVLEMQLATSVVQALTDPGSLLVTQFTVTPTLRTVPLGLSCSPTCCWPAAVGTCPGVDGAVAHAACPVLNIRRYDIVLRGEAPNNRAVVREIRESVRVRNDEMPFAACP